MTQHLQIGHQHNKLTETVKLLQNSKFLSDPSLKTFLGKSLGKDSFLCFPPYFICIVFILGKLLFFFCGCRTYRERQKGPFILVPLLIYLY